MWQFAIGPSVNAGHPSGGYEPYGLLLLQLRTNKLQMGNQHLRFALELEERQGTGTINPTRSQSLTEPSWIHTGTADTTVWP